MKKSLFCILSSIILLLNLTSCNAIVENSDKGSVHCIYISKLPDKIDYYADNEADYELDLTGMQVMAHYVSGNLSEVTNQCVFTGFKLNKYCDCLHGIGITYKSSDGSFHENLCLRTHQHTISSYKKIKGASDIYVNDIAQKPDLSGMEYEITYGNGETVVITGAFSWVTANITNLSQDSSEIELRFLDTKIDTIKLVKKD